MTELVLYGLSFSLFVSFLICMISILKKLLSGRITASVHYYIWFVPLAGPAASFFPKFQGSFESAPSDLPSAAAFSLAAAGLSHDTPEDLFVNAHSLISQPAAAGLLAVWLMGTMFMIVRIFRGIYGVRRLCRASTAAPPSLLAELYRCQDKLHMNLPVKLRISDADSLKSPAAMGFFNPCILLPKGCKEKQLPYILLHELVHCKHKDALLNLAMQLFLAFNWYNLFVWYAVKQMEHDRELCCDSFVLALLDKRQQLTYGRVLIDCAAGQTFPAVGMKQTAKALYKRIIHVAEFRMPNSHCRRMSYVFLAVMVIAASAFAPSAASLTDESYTPAADMNIEYKNLQTYFGDLQGSFVLYDLKKDSYIVYNKDAAAARVSPNSTYKIYSGLLALESGFTEASFQKWDGTVYPLDAWNREQTLSSAMRSSVNWYFQNLDKKAGKGALQKFYDFIGYGNRNLSGGVARFWMESSLKISPFEQVVLLTGLYENRWSFREEHIRAIKSSLKISDRFFGKTGTGMVDGKTINGWFVGYTEPPSGPQIFALNLQGPDGASGTRAAEIAQMILSDQGLL